METHPSAAVTVGTAFEFWLAPIVAIWVSTVYFKAAPKTQPLWQRLLAASHGVAIAIIYVCAMILSWTNLSRPEFGTPFIFLLLLPVLLTLVSASLFRGSQSVHWLQVINAAALAWTFFIGIMAVTGDWL